MTDLLKDLADIRARIELAMDAVRKAKPAPADWAGEPKWESLHGSHFYCANKISVGYAAASDRKHVWGLYTHCAEHRGEADTLERAKELVESCYRNLPDARKRELLDMPKEATSATPGPCNWCHQPDAVTKAAVTLAEAYFEYVNTNVRSRNYPDAFDRLNAAREAYLAAKVAAVDGAGKGATNV